MRRKLFLTAMVILIAFALPLGCNSADDGKGTGDSAVMLDFPKSISVKDGALHWKEVDGATSYIVYDGDIILTKNLTNTFYDVSALSDGVHRLSVVAKNGEASSAKSIVKYYVSDSLSKRVSAGEVHTLFIDCYGNMWGVGDNSFGQLGIEGTHAAEPTVLVEGVKFDRVAAGGDFSLALDVDGNLWSWGCNSFGQLATGDMKSVSAPQKSPLDLKFSYISAGNSYALAIDNDGYVWSWGCNYEGRLGCGDKVDKKVPVKAKLNAKAVSVAAGYSHSIAIDSDGNMWGWGNNYCGQLGDVEFIESGVAVPSKINVDGKIVSASVALNRTLALDENGKLHYFGRNGEFDGLLNESETYSFAAASNNGFALVKSGGKTIAVFDGESVKEYDAAGVINLAAGGDHYIYGSVDNDFYSFGSNISNQLGYSGEYPYFKKIDLRGEL